MKTMNCRINKRATDAGIALFAVKDKMDPKDLQLVEDEIKRAFEGTMPSSRMASLLTAEILLRRYGAAI